MLNISAAIIFGLAMMALTLMAFRAFRGVVWEKNKKAMFGHRLRSLRPLREGDVVLSILAGVAVGLIDYVAFALAEAGAATEFAFILVTVLMIMTVIFMVCSSMTVGIVDSLVFIAIYVLLYLVTKAVMLVAVAKIMNWGWYYVLTYLPLTMLIVAITIEVATFLYSRYQELDEDKNESAGLYKWLVLLAILVGIGIFVWQVAVPVGKVVFGEYGSRSASVEQEEINQVAVTTHYDWHYYNRDVQTDGRDDNDYNFGPDPRILHPNYSTAIDYYLDLVDRMNGEAPYLNYGCDPTLGIAILAASDNQFGTTYLGVTRLTEDELNRLVDYYRSRPSDYQRFVQRFVIDLANDKNAWIEMKDYPAGSLTSQMYQNPNTADGYPDIVICETPDRGGLALVIHRGSKELILRVPCGYQPCNLVRIEPRTDPYVNPPTQPYNPPTPEPTRPTEPESPTPEPTKPTEPETPTKPTEPETPTKPTEPETPTRPTEPETPTKPTEPETPTTYNKDPEKASYENVEPNDDPGPGENTNNGIGAQYSIKDLPNNSDHMDTYEDYTKAIEELKEINEVQKTGDDDNTPSYTPPAPEPVTNGQGIVVEQPTIKIDNSGDNGNARDNAAPINETVPTPGTAHIAVPDPGNTAPQELPTIDNSPAGEWGGPPD